MAKRFYFTESESALNCMNDHVGNIRGARTKAQKYANEHGVTIIINDCETEEMLDFIYPDALDADVAEEVEKDTDEAKPVEKEYLFEKFTADGDYIPKSLKTILAKSISEIDLAGYINFGFSESNKTYEHKIALHADDKEGNQITITADWSEEDIEWIKSRTVKALANIIDKYDAGYISYGEAIRTIDERFDMSSIPTEEVFMDFNVKNGNSIHAFGDIADMKDIFDMLSMEHSEYSIRLHCTNSVDSEIYWNTDDNILKVVENISPDNIDWTRLAGIQNDNTVWLVASAVFRGIAVHKQFIA